MKVQNNEANIKKLNQAKFKENVELLNRLIRVVSSIINCQRNNTTYFSFINFTGDQKNRFGVVDRTFYDYLF